MADHVTAVPVSAKSVLLVLGDTVLPRFVRQDYLKDMYDLQLRDTDILVVTWPKSGTTWMQHLVSQVIYGKDYVPKTHLHEDHIFLEAPQQPLDESSDGNYKLIDDVPPPRFLKSHLLIRFLPRDVLKNKTKVIYLVRNPKDAAVSYYHFCLMTINMPTYSWDELVDNLCEGTLPFGDWFEHVLKWWEKRNDPNVLFIKYEDMKKDLKKVIAQVGTFLNKSLTEDDLNEICYNSTFENMKKQPKANPDFIFEPFKKEGGKHLKFMRKGAVGDWKNFFTVAQSERFDQIYQTKMAGTGLELSFE